MLAAREGHAPSAAHFAAEEECTAEGHGKPCFVWKGFIIL